MKTIWQSLFEKTVEQENLIHSITSPIAINDCANVVLALGAKPIMAEHPREVYEITSIAKALTVSYANITDARMESIMISGKTAKEKALPHIIDAVGVTCSKMRMEEVKKYISECCPTVIKGNVSEIKALAGIAFENAGIDVSKKDAVGSNNEAAVRTFAEEVKEYAKRVGAIVVATGEIDIISDGEQCILVKNGCAEMAKITGTGCILTCIMGVYLGTAKQLQLLQKKEAPSYLEAVTLAAVLMGIAGETAKLKESGGRTGLGSYHVSFIDALSEMTFEKLAKEAKFTYIS